MKNLNSRFGLLALALAAPLLPAAAQTIDPTFAAARIYAPGTVFSTLEQPDGKRVIAGDFIRVNGVAASTVSRFNADGTLDAAFQQNVGAGNGTFRLRRGNSGQFLVSGFSLGVPVVAGGISRLEPLRLNADGTGDASFNVGAGAARENGATTYVDDMLTLPSGQVVVVGPFVRFNGVVANRIARLTSTGAVDATFNAGSGANREIETVVAVAGGKLLIGGYFSTYNGNPCNGLARLNADGSYDPTFVHPLAANSDATNIVVQPDGRILLAGDVGNTNGPNRGITRLLADGAADPSFTPPAALNASSVSSLSGEALQVQPDGKIVFITKPGQAGSGTAGIGRLNADGSLDPTFQSGAGPNDKPRTLTLLADGKLLVGGGFSEFSGTINRPLVQLTGTGALDPSFQPLIQKQGSVEVVRQQADGTLVVGGNISEFNGQAVRNLVRLTTAGAVDGSFVTTSGFVRPVVDLALLADGRVLAASESGLRRFLATGQPDNEFTSPDFSNSRLAQLLLQPDGRVLVAGQGPFVNSGIRSATTLVRLQANGTPDGLFAPTSSLRDSFTEFQRMALQTDGKIVLAGTFTDVLGNKVVNLIRLLGSGATDALFGGAGFSRFADINDIVVQPDGKVLVGGRFSTYGGAARLNVARLNATGTLDADFVPPAISGAFSSITTLVLQPNNRVLLGGFFSGPDLPTNLARLLPTGAADASFAATAVPNGNVSAILIQPNGGLVIGGNFTTVGGQDRPALARLTAPNVLSATAPPAVAERTAAWPVPARGTLFVAPAPTAHPQTLELLDALGRTVRQQPLRAGGAPAQVSVETLPAGLYLLRVHYAEGTVSRRVQVQ